MVQPDQKNRQVMKGFIPLNIFKFLTPHEHITKIKVLSKTIRKKTSNSHIMRKNKTLNIRSGPGHGDNCWICMYNKDHLFALADAVDQIVINVEEFFTTTCTAHGPYRQMLDLF